MKKECLQWQAPGLPFSSQMQGAQAAYFDGRSFALELLEYVVTVQSLQGYTSEQQNNMARAALSGFLSAILPPASDALTLFADEYQHGLLSGLVCDVADGAAMALDLAQGGEY